MNEGHAPVLRETGRVFRQLVQYMVGRIDLDTICRVGHRRKASATLRRCEDGF